MFTKQVKFKKVDRMLTKIKLTFDILEDVNELEELALTQMLDTDGFLAFSGDVIKREVEDAMKNVKLGIDEKGKSKSKILRGLIWQYWSQFYDGSKTDEEYYNLVMDHFIQMIKDKTKDKEK